jgi:hypothetical protein
MVAPISSQESAGTYFSYVAFFSFGRFMVPVRKLEAGNYSAFQKKYHCELSQNYMFN